VQLIANVVVGFVALLHLYFRVLEMFRWDRPAAGFIRGLARSAEWRAEWRDLVLPVAHGPVGDGCNVIGTVAAAPIDSR
jgi:hypothetical protein